MNKLIPVGFILDNDHIVVKGAYYFTGTVGLPLEVTHSQLLSMGIQICWTDYILHGISEGAKFNTIVSRIISAVGDVQGPRIRDVIKNKLANVCKK